MFFFSLVPSDRIDVVLNFLFVNVHVGSVELVLKELRVEIMQGSETSSTQSSSGRVVFSLWLIMFVYDRIRAYLSTR